jgi:hypothetical protein
MGERPSGRQRWAAAIRRTILNYDEAALLGPEHAHDQDNEQNDHEKADQPVAEHGKSERHDVPPS